MTTARDGSPAPTQFNLATGGWVNYHPGEKKKYSCGACHIRGAGPEMPAKGGFIRHEEVAAAYGEKNIHGQDKIACIECHMPYATKSAVKFDTYIGDVRTHTFRINPDAAYTMFGKDGKIAKGELSLDFSCLGCHKGRDMQWAAENAGAIHT